MRNRNVFLTVSLIAMMVVGGANAAQIASTDYVAKSVGDEADLVWTAIDALNDEESGAVATANAYTDEQVGENLRVMSSALDGKQDTISDLNDIRNGADLGATAVQPDALAEYATKDDLDSYVDESTFERALNNKVTVGTKVQEAVMADSASSADFATTAQSANTDSAGNIIVNTYVTNDALVTGLAGKADLDENGYVAIASTAVKALQDMNGNFIQDTYATKDALASGLSGKLDTDGTITIDQVDGLSDALANAGSKPDAELSETSENSVQNKVVTAALNAKADASALDSLATREELSAKVDVTTLDSYATTSALEDGLAEKLDTDGTIAISQVDGLSDALANAGSKPDAELSDTSENSVQNKVVTAALNAKADASALDLYATTSALEDGLAEKLGKTEKAASAATADSATTATQDASGNVITETYATKGELGSYALKTQLPTVPTNVGAFTNDAGYITAAQDKDTTYKAGTNISIASDGTISATDTNTTYTAGTGLSLNGTTFSANAATADVAGIMKWGQIPSGGASGTKAATIWVQ